MGDGDKSYKLSRYNLILPWEEGNLLAYNTHTNGLARIETDVWAKISANGDSHDPLCGLQDNDRDREIMSKLVTGRFVVPRDLDELDYLEVYYNQAKFSTNTLGLTIAPTLACNFRCDYCYEERRANYMTREVEQAIVEFIRRTIHSLRALSITWYGGEPLLALNTIERLSAEFIALCDEHSCQYGASMVTNGYLLTPATASSLESMRVGTVQVTLDGLPHTHNERRPLVDGSPTFETIVNNLRALPAQLYVPLRINVDKRNRSSVINLLRSLEELGITGKSNRIHPYIAPVTAHMEACAHVAPDCMGKREFSEFEIEIIEELLEEGINLVRYPLRMVGTCGASRVMSYVVDPEGLLYKCWNETGTAGWSVGHISSETVELGSRLTRWLQYTPFRRTDCRECTYLPLCNGGCPYLSLWLPEEISDCTHWRYYLEQMLRLYTRLGIVETKVP